MPTRLEKMIDQDQDTYDFGQFTRVPKDKRPTQVSILTVKQEIPKCLLSFSNTILNTAFYGYAFLIYTAAEWTTLGNSNQVVSPTNVGTYIGFNQAARYRYKSRKELYAAYKSHKDATVRMVIYIFLRGCISFSP